MPKRPTQPDEINIGLTEHNIEQMLRGILVQVSLTLQIPAENMQNMAHRIATDEMFWEGLSAATAFASSMDQQMKGLMRTMSQPPRPKRKPRGRRLKALLDTLKPGDQLQ